MPLVVHYWADLQSVHGFCCCGNITRTRNVNEYILVLALCLVTAALHSRCGHYVFAVWFLSFFFLMAALWNRAHHYIFVLYFVLLSFFFGHHLPVT